MILSTFIPTTTTTTIIIMWRYQKYNPSKGKQDQKVILFKEFDKILMFLARLNVCSTNYLFDIICSRRKNVRQIRMRSLRHDHKYFRNIFNLEAQNSNRSILQLLLSSKVVRKKNRQIIFLFWNFFLRFDFFLLFIDFDIKALNKLLDL